jgi:signal transduction histidine kinase
MDTDARDVAVRLHDGPMQDITLARLQLDLLRARADGALAAELDAISELLDTASADLQRALRALGAAARP